MNWSGIGAGAGNAISGVAGALGSLASSFVAASMGSKGQYKSYKYNRKLQQQQYDLQQRGYLEGPTNARQGFVNAGYNPILALNSGASFAGSGSGGSVGAPNYPNIDLTGSASNAYRAFKLEKQHQLNENLTTEATVSQANAQADLNKQQALTEEAKRTQMEFQNAMLDVEKHLKEKELSWADRKFYSEIYDNMQRAENYGAMASIARYNAQINYMNAQTNAKNAVTARMTGLSEHNARQVELNLKKVGLMQSAYSTAGGVIRDFGLGIGSLMTGRGVLNKSQGSHSNSNHIQKVVKSLHSFGRTRMH